MAIADKLTRLQDTKRDLRDALAAHGMKLDGQPFSEYTTILMELLLKRGLFGRGEQGAWFDPAQIKQYKTLGEELVSNGGFDTDTDWEKQASWSIGGGSAYHDGSANGFINQLKDEVQEGATYEVRATVSDWTGTGTLRVLLGEAVYHPFATGNGEVVTTFRAGSNGYIRLYAYDTHAFRIDNVSVREVTIDSGKVNMYQDAQGNTPVLLPGDPVGLMLDTRLGLEREGEFFDITQASDVGELIVVDSSGGTFYREAGGTNSATVTFGPPVQELGLVNGDYVEIDLSFVSGSGFLRLSVYSCFDSLDAEQRTFGLAPARRIIPITDATQPIVFGWSGSDYGSVSDVTIKKLPGNHASQLTSSRRPTYQSDGTLHWVEFDGVDDNLFLGRFAVPTDFWQCLAFDTNGDTKGVFWWDSGVLADKWAHLFEDGSTDSGIAHSANFTFNGAYVNGAERTLTTRGEAHDAIAGNRVSVWSSTSSNPTPEGQWAFGGYSGSGYALSGKLYGMVWRDGLNDDDRRSVEACLSKKAGLPWVYQPFTPLNLFRYSEAGAWYDPSQIERYKSLSDTELVTNGAFDTGIEGWNAARAAAILSHNNGRLRITGDGGNPAAAQELTTLEAGKIYQASARIYAGTVSAAYLRVSASHNVGSADYVEAKSQEDTRIQMVFTAGPGPHFIGGVASVSADGQYFEIDDVSVREVILDHAKVNLYQDIAGTEPVLLPGDPVGLMLDTRLGLERGSESWADQVPAIIDYDGSTGFYDAATRTLSNTTAATSYVAYPRFRFDLGLTTGTRYAVSGFLSGDLSVLLDGANAMRLATSGGDSGIPIDRSTGEFGGIILATAPVLEVIMDGKVGSITIDSITVKAIPGNHASQATSAARPTHAGLTYDGVDDYLQCTTLPTGQNSLMFAAVARIESSSADGGLPAIIARANNIGNRSFGIRLSTNGEPTFFRYETETVDTFHTTVITGQNNLSEWDVLLVRLVDGVGELRSYRTGAKVAITSNVGTLANNSRLEFGRYFADGSYERYTKGEIPAGIYAHGKYSEREADNLMDYLARYIP